MSPEGTIPDTPGSPLRVSIIVPVYNNPHDLRECLSALQGAAGLEAELIVVDDASTDDTPMVAAQMGARVLQLAQNVGPAAARNYGARHAQGDILFFVDADVVVAADAVRRIVALFTAHSDLAAVFGSYDTHPRAPGLVSQYRNLLHHYVHQNGNPEASTFWAGCGAIRRAVFQELGGFDGKCFPRPSIEDIELGYRLRQSGHRILLDKGLHGTHLKRWTLRSVIRTDVLDRAIPWARLLLERQQAPADLNLQGGQRLCGVLVGMASLCLPLATVRLELLALALGALGSVVGLNRTLYIFFWRQRGWRFALGSLPLHLLYYWYSGLSYVYVWLGFHLHRAARRSRRPGRG